MQPVLYRSYSKGLCMVYLSGTSVCAGILESSYLGKSISFRNEIEFLFAVDSLMNQIGGPQESFMPRNFFNHSRRKWTVRKAELNMAEDTNKIIPIKADTKATFVIDVQYRQHASWQGTITWAEKGETRRFRSVLEMLRLMSEAQPEQDKVVWDEDT